MSDEINDMTELACEGSDVPLTTTPVVGTPSRSLAATLVPGGELVAPGEVRVTILGSGDPFVRPSQASASVLIEVGNPERDLFFFDLGSGALKNFTGLRLPVTATTKVFLSHLHADHVGDMPTLLYSLAKAGRRDPVEVWGPAGATEALGTHAYARALQTAHAWDMESLNGHPGQSGARAVTTEVPYDTTATVYERNGVTITSFPVIHIQDGAVGYRLDYAGRSVVFSGDTRPCRTLVDASRRCGPADPRDVPLARRVRPEGRGPAGVRRDDRQQRAHQPRDGRQGVRPRGRPDVGDVASRRRPRHRRVGLPRHAHPATTGRSRSPRTSPCSTSPPTRSWPVRRSSIRSRGRSSAPPW